MSKTKLPKLDFTPPEDAEWTHYRVNIPHAERGKAFELSPWIEKTERFRITTETKKRGKTEVYRLYKEDFIKDGSRILWLFELEPEGRWLRRMSKQILNTEHDVVGRTDYHFPETQWEYPHNLCHVFTIHETFAVQELHRRLRFEGQVIITEDAIPVRVWFQMDKSETIRTPEGRVNCWRLRLDPDLKEIMGRWAWASRIVHPFVPDFLFWVEKREPHQLVKFQGQLGPVGASSVQVYERMPKA